MTSHASPSPTSRNIVTWWRRDTRGAAVARAQLAVMEPHIEVLRAEPPTSLPGVEADSPRHLPSLSQDIEALERFVAGADHLLAPLFAFDRMRASRVLVRLGLALTVPAAERALASLRHARARLLVSGLVSAWPGPRSEPPTVERLLQLVDDHAAALRGLGVEVG